MNKITKIVLASGNAGKVREINKLFADSGIEVISQSDLNVPEVPETGTTFVENAIIKARHAAEVTGLPAISDDSGIEVDALNARPGVYSARYAGANASDEDNNNLMLKELTSVAEAERTARYQCLIVFMRSHTDPVPIITQGSWEGRILEAPQGDCGFGYDPIFYVPTHNCSGGELPLDVKNTLSHRAIALNTMLEEFKKHNYL
ncbi:Nucleoside 5-triphosphatase RdgB (dHAPTP, dITP, XTP-specific) [hydrothermal vent metagenome]|uniref:dITP/XTP pyrophosphatase n=1 Tax=hydrothermal vent metagenome TaxID=652676 RepID=A0A3B0XC15_9ZZZZ